MTQLHTRDLPVLEAFRVDRDECGEGLLLTDVACLAETRYPGAVIRRLNQAGYQVGEWRGRYQMGHVEPAASTGAPGAETDAPSSLPPVSGAPVDVAAPRLFDPRTLCVLEAA